MAEHPMQPIYLDENGTARFKPNKLVRFLLDWASPRGMNLNDLAIIPFDNEDREQFAQLIGYSVSGFVELSYTRPTSITKADEIVDRLVAART